MQISYMPPVSLISFSDFQTRYSGAATPAGRALHPEAVKASGTRYVNGSVVLGHNALGNGQPQAECHSGSGPDQRGKSALEDLARHSGGIGSPWLGQFRRTVIPAPPWSYLGLATGLEYLGVVQQNLSTPAPFLIAADGDPLVHLGGQGEAPAQRTAAARAGSGGQTAEIHWMEHKVGFGAVRVASSASARSGAHLAGHGQDVGQKAGLAGRGPGLRPVGAPHPS